MRIQKLVIEGYQGLNYLNLDFDTPIVLVAGKNGTGKSSLRDAIEFALTNQSGRVAMKKDYGDLVRRGSDPKKAQVALTVDGFTFSRKIASGKAGHEQIDTPIVLPFLLGSSRFAWLDSKEQARLLTAVSKIKRDLPTIKAMMADRGIAAHCIEQAGVMLNAGFASALKECKSEQSAARGRWEGITGDRFGEAKAMNWKAEVPEGIDLAGAKEALAEIDATLPGLEQQYATARELLGELTDAVKMAGTLTCPCCNESLSFSNGKLGKPQTAESAEELDKRRDAQAIICEKMSNSLQQIRSNRVATSMQINHAENAERDCARKNKGANKAFEDYKDWLLAAEAMAPTGIELTLLEKGLIPVNKHLAETCEVTGWKQIVINSDLGITFGGLPYNLCSESEQWRIDAAIAECFSALSNVKLFILDRMDVLHPSDRSGLLNWLIQVAPRHDSIFVLATLKSAPVGLPKEITPVWLEDGNRVLEVAA